MPLTAKVADRITSGLKKFQPILGAAKARDVNESDTVIIVMDLLHELFGYDKYGEISSEHMIRSTWCDLAIKLKGELCFLIEVKAIGTDLKDQHTKQAVDYAANQGCDWVVLTNGDNWRVYKVAFEKPISSELLVELSLTSVNTRKADEIEMVGLLAKEGWRKERLGEYASRRQALSRFYLGAITLSDPVVEVIRRELRRATPDCRVEADEVRKALRDEVIKREVLEGDQADSARRHVSRSAGRALRASAEESDSSGPPASSSSASS